MTVTLITPPASTALTTLARVKDELLLSAGSHDAFLTRLIHEASETIQAWAGRPLYRAEWRETRTGSARELLSLSRYPVASLGAVLLEDSAVTDCEIGNAEAGLLFRPSGFGWSADPTEWSVTYTAGWFLPGDDFSGSISVAASDDSYNSTGFPALLRAGDLLYADGFTSAANNGFKTVVTAITTKITVSAALVDDSAASRTLALSNLPGWIERVVQTLVALAYHARDRDPALTDLSLGPASYAWSHDAVRPLQRRIQSLSLPL